MGEIKSTLDISMEKTRGLTLSDDEKRAFHEEETQKKVSGMLRRYLDGQLREKRFAEEFKGVAENDRESALRVLRQACVKRMDPLGDNGPVLSLLKGAAGMDTAPVELVLTQGRRELEEKQADLTEALREKYTARGISGSAVIPNPESDPEWRRLSSEIRAEIGEKLAALLQ